MAVHEKLYTADELWEISHRNGDKRYELVKGELIEMVPTGDMHGAVTMDFGADLVIYVRTHDLGLVVGTDTGFALFNDPDTVRAPDIAFIAKARLMPLTGKYFTIAPDLAVEVISPSESASEINDKILEYFEAGVKLVWIIYPKSRTIHVYTAADEVKILKANQLLDGRDVLPGFQITVNDVFKRLQG
jgi:Uma2 family endonuclease